MHNNIRVFCQSLGCDKNLCDSEHMAGELTQSGYVFVDEPTEADVAIVNTCCFIHDAKQESIDEILALADLKDSGSLRGLIVTGCLAQRYQDEIRTEIPQVDAILGTMAMEDMETAIRKVLKGQQVSLYPSIDRPLNSSAGSVKRELSGGGHYAYLKIAEGCDRRCTYCIIPYVRGKYRSIPIETLISEATDLAQRGVRELILVAQETSLYGTDLYGHKSLPRLLRELCRIEGLSWIRLLYAYPEEIDDELIETIATEPGICNYIDMPIQHCSDTVLKRMGRHITGEALAGIIHRIRERIPDIAIRTTLITGFPGESEEDFRELYRFVNEMEFSRLGVFTYSAEEGTPAALMADQVPWEVAKRRRDEIMELQQAVAFDRAEELSSMHPVLEVFVEGYIPEEGVYVGRTYMDAPDVDGFIFFGADRELMSGDLVSVRVDGAREYDLLGTLTDNRDSH